MGKALLFRRFDVEIARPVRGRGPKARVKGQALSFISHNYC